MADPLKNLQSVTQNLPNLEDRGDASRVMVIHPALKRRDIARTIRCCD